MASSMLVAAAVAAASASTSASLSAQASPSGCKDGDDTDTVNSTQRSCANDPDFAVICAFFQKFSNELGIEVPSFRHLQEWLSNSDEVSDYLRDLHIKLLRKTRKTVHEKSWESALSKFCFTYSAQDAWEVERFGYKKSSLKVKLRILRALLESQFERNGKFRAKILALSANSLRSQPIGRDRLGHSYWLTQDDDCNLRIYQEHLDEEIWQVVATNREELVKLIARLRGNEVVLPSTDIGLVDEDTSSSNSYLAPVEKPPPPEEQEDDSQEEEAKIPNLRIKLNAATNQAIIDDSAREKSSSCEEDTKSGRKRLKTRAASQSSKSVSSHKDEDESKEQVSESVWEFGDKNSASPDDVPIVKKARPSLLDANRAKKPSKYEKAKSEDDEEEEDLSIEEEDIDSAAAEEDENEEKEIEEFDDDDDESDNIGEAIEDPPVVVHGEGAGMDCDVGNPNTCQERNLNFLEFFSESFDLNFDNSDPVVGIPIEEEVIYFVGNGQGRDCLVGNSKNESASTSITPPSEPKATFFFGQPGCLKLSPMKQLPKIEMDSKDSNLAECKKPKMQNLENIEKSEKSENEQNAENTENAAKDENVIENKEESAVSNVTEEEVSRSKDLERESISASNGDKVLKKGDSEEKINDVEGNEDKNRSESLKAKKSDESLQSSKPEHCNDTPVKDDKLILKEQNEDERKQSVELKTENSIATETKVDQVAASVSKTENADSDINKTEPEPKREQELKPELESKRDLELKPELEPQPEPKVELKPEMQPPQITSRETDKNKKDEVGEAERPNEVTKIVPTSASTIITNRKRRLSDFLAATQSIRQSTSESEVDVASENVEECGDPDNELNEVDIGGKRLKMRPKVTNAELRKKVEAQKCAVEETTSSSGEDDMRRRRKIILPRKQIDRNLRIEKSIEHEEKSIEQEQAEIKKPVEQINEVPSESKAKMDVKRLMSTVITATPSTTVTASVITTTTIVVKQKPTLAEIIEKKLKKTPEKPSTSTNTTNSTCKDTKEEISPPKKSPITKPLKKNLLTQIRQEESDEEAIPRKRTTTNDTNLTTTTVEAIKPPENKDEAKQNDSDQVSALPERKTPERQLKRRNSTDIKESVPPPPKCEEKIDNSTTQTAAEAAAKPGPTVASRRSGRRGGATVVYAELPQPKRTRSGVRTTTVKKAEPEVKIEEPNEDKLESSPAKASKSEDNAEDKERIIINKKAQQQQEIKKEPEKGLEVEPEKVEVKEIKEEIIASPGPSPPSSSTNNNTTPAGPARGRGTRKKREVDTTNIIDTTDAETPVRQSRRIAQQKIREEAERRKLEEIALRTMKEELKKKKKAEKEADPTVIEPSEHSSSESEVEMKKRAKKKCPGKDGWSSGSEEQEEPEEEDDPPHEDTDPGSPLFKSDHEFSPESDLEDETQVVPMKRARTARKENAEDDDDSGDEEACQKCGKSDHPEWILLCDNCDKGYHCSCLSPVLFYIPEGDWYCPPCQQEQLIAALERQLKEFDELVERKRLEEEEKKRLAAEAERAEQERLQTEEIKKQRKKKDRKEKRRGESGMRESSSGSGSDSGENESEEKSAKGSEDDSDDKKAKKKSKNNDFRESGKRRRGDRRNRRRAATRGVANRRRRRDDSDSDASGSSRNASVNASGSQSSSSSSSTLDSDDEPIYKLRKRRQINVSYRLNEYDDLINSALRKEMNELDGDRNVGRGKDISTIIEAEKERKAEDKLLERAESEAGHKDEENANGEEKDGAAQKDADDSENDDEPLKRRSKPNIKKPVKKKPRKLTTLDISSEEDDASDEDFKTSSIEEDEEDDTSISVSTNSDTSLEVYRRRSKEGKKQRKAARRAASERRKDRRFVVDESDEDEEVEPRKKSKKKRDDDSDYTESETDGSDVSENVEDLDSADLCDDTTSESDGAWYPSKRKKQRKSNTTIARKSPKLKKPQGKRAKRVEYSDDDISESEEIEDDDDDDIGGGKGSGKQPRSQPLKPSKGKGKGKGKGKSPIMKKKKKKKSSEDDESLTDSEDSTRRTRGRRYAYLDDFDDDSSDGGIKPGVKRPDTPPEEREKFIQKQEEIKRMLAEKNAEGAKLVATPRLTPLKSGTEKEKRSPAKAGDSLSTVPLSVIRQAKVLDADYLQRKGESIGDLDNVDDVDEFDDADLPDDFPEDMDEDTIARMVEEEEEFNVAAAARDLPAPYDVLRTPTKSKISKETSATVAPAPTVSSTLPAAATAAAVVGREKGSLMSPALAALSQMPGPTTSTSGLQEPMRKRLPMPTMHPPLLRHQFPQHAAAMSAAGHMLQRHPAAPPTHLLQNALSAPLGQPLNRNNFPHPPRLPINVPSGHPGAGPHLLNVRSPLPGSQPLPPASAAEVANESDSKPRGRRKKITPLRDPLQKQQAAAAATAAASHTEKTEPTAAPVGVIKSPASGIPPAQSPDIYKPLVSGGGTQLSVITRMPHLPASAHAMPVSKTAGGMYPGSEASRFYGPLQQAGMQRHRGAPPVPGLLSSHSDIRTSYGPPPPLRGSAGSSANPSQLSIPTSIVSGVRAGFPPGDHRGLPGLGSVYGTPPPARHTSTHLNPYRPPIYGNPNCPPRPPVGGSLRAASLPHNLEYPAGVRPYSPFGYYPPPPPLTTPHPNQPIPPVAPPPPSSSATSTTVLAAPSSVIVSATSANANATAAAANKNSVVQIAPKPVSSNVAIVVPPTPTTASSTAPSVVATVAKEETQKKLTTLEAYTVSTTKSPLAIAGESSGSHSSAGVHTDVTDDSSSAPVTAAATAPTADAERGGSEFSGLVSYFSSQHDDYNT